MDTDNKLADDDPVDDKSQGGAEDSKDDHAGNAKQEWQVGDEEEYELKWKSKLILDKKYSLTNSFIKPPRSSKRVII